MTFTLVALFLATGKMYPERAGLTLHHCAAHAAIERQKLKESDLEDRIGKVRYLCVPRFRMVLK